MKTLLFALFSLAAFGQTVQLTVTYTIPTAVQNDLQAYIHTQFSDPITTGLPSTPTLASAMTANDTTATLVSVVGYPASGVVFIDNEAMSYSGVSAAPTNQLTGLSRGIQNTTAATHAGPTSSTLGAQVHNLTYTGVQGLMRSRFVLPGVQQILLQLGTASTYLNTSASAISAAQATESSSLATVVQ